MRLTSLIFILLPLISFSQTSFEFQELSYSGNVPTDIANARTAVVVNLQSLNQDGFTVDGDWKSFGEQVHDYLHKMGVDAVVYINLKDYQSGNSTKQFYIDLLSTRGTNYLIFLNEKKNGYELVCTAFDKEENLFKAGQEAYRIEGPTLKSVLLNFAREIKRINQFSSNFLIPEKPFFANEIPIVENLNLKNYPGQIRRSNLAIEKFQKIDVPKSGSEELIGKINSYNAQIELKNEQLRQVLQELQNELPYELKYIDFMSDEELLRKRHQFVLRSVYASGESIRSLLKYKEQSSAGGYVSVIPIMPDNTTIKNIPKNALVHKFYIRQNIIKNVYVGEWDADETWQDALRNYIRNMIQYFNKGN